MMTIDKTFAGIRKFIVRRFAKMFFQWVLLLSEGLQKCSSNGYCYCQKVCKRINVTSTVKLNSFVWFATNWQTYQRSAAAKCLSVSQSLE
jgi:hypothetical protein